eukprot:12230584-Alexandrium_andersonii.AAC.1
MFLSELDNLIWDMQLDRDDASPEDAFDKLVQFRGFTNEVLYVQRLAMAAAGLAELRQAFAQRCAHR